MFKNKNITIPNLITLTSATCGLIGIYFISKDLIFPSILFLASCDIFDTLDGFIARKFKMYSPIGQDLDSLVDAIVFLLPPFFLLLRYESLILLLSSILLVFAGVYRLARYNVEKKSPSKVKGLIVSQPAHYIYFSLLLGASVNFLIILCLITSLLMVAPFYTSEKYTDIASKVMIFLNLVGSVFKIII